MILCLQKLQMWTNYKKLLCPNLSIKSSFCCEKFVSSTSCLASPSEKNYETLCFCKATELSCIYKGIQLITTKYVPWRTCQVVFHLFLQRE